MASKSILGVIEEYFNGDGRDKKLAKLLSLKDFIKHLLTQYRPDFRIRALLGWERKIFMTVLMKKM